jgi:hypothetical protein
MSTQHEYERGYRNPLTGEGQRDPRYLKAAILCLVLGLALLYPIFCSGQELPPGALPSETVLRISAGSSGTGTQPPFAPTTRPASHSLLPLALTYVGLQGVDFAMTTRCVQQGRCSEANPAMRGVVDSPLKFALLKGAVTSGTIYGVWSLRKTHPRAATWLLIGMSGAQAAIVMSNARQLR